MKTEAQKGIAALILLALFYSVMGIIVRAMETLPLFEQNYVRVLGALLVGAVIFNKRLRVAILFRISGKDWGAVIFRGISFALGVLFFVIAFTSHDTSYSDATFVTVFPLLPIFGYMFLKEKLSAPMLGWIGLGVIGLICLSIADFSHFFTWGRGELFAFLSAVAFDMSYIARKWQSDTLREEESLMLVFVVQAVIMIACSFLAHEPFPQLDTWTNGIWLAVAAGAIFNVVNMFLTGYGFKRVPAAVGGNILTLETFFALLISIFIYAEIPTIREFIGGLLIVVSVYQLNRLTSEE